MAGGASSTGSFRQIKATTVVAGGITLGSSCLWYASGSRAQGQLPVVRRQINVASFLVSPATAVDLAAASTLAHKLGVTGSGYDVRRREPQPRGPSCAPDRG